MKIATWNIGGGFISSTDKGKFDTEDLNYFVHQLKPLMCDVVCFQEAHSAEDSKQPNQVQEITKKLGLPFVAFQPYATSHLKDGQVLTLGIASKFKIVSWEFLKLSNPKMEIKRPNGDYWVSHDKGFISSVLDYKGTKVRVLCGHNFPFQHFNRDFTEDEFKHIRGEIETIVLSSRLPTLLAADMNYEDLQKVVPAIFSQNFADAFIQPTIPDGTQQDHILLSSHWNTIRAQVISGLADHYLCYAEMSLK